MNDRRLWVIPGGCIPVESHGREPDFISHDRLSILNSGTADLCVRITVYYEDREPVGPYRIAVRAHRVRSFRLNDLIEPEALLLGTNYALTAEAEEPFTVQFGRLDSRAAELASFSAIAYGE